MGLEIGEGFFFETINGNRITPTDCTTDNTAPPGPPDKPPIRN